jgi:uncharacterized protein YgfB (UPF0149 family)
MAASVSALDLPDHAALDDEIRAVALAVNAFELHGSLCGYLCGGGDSDRGDWLQRLALQADGVAGEADSALDQLYQATTRQLDAQDFDFTLLQASEADPLDVRADALVAWCRGFLGGFGLAAPPASSLSEEANEAVEDIGRIAASSLSYDGGESDEEALAEIIEFVRVAALLVHGDCVLGARSRQHLH